jgi:hypothetical protein
MTNRRGELERIDATEIRNTIARDLLGPVDEHEHASRRAAQLLSIGDRVLDRETGEEGEIVATSEVVGSGSRVYSVRLPVAGLVERSSAQLLARPAKPTV